MEFYLPKFLIIYLTLLFIMNIVRTMEKENPLFSFVIKIRKMCLNFMIHDNAHVWVLTVADCFSTNRKRVRCTQVNLQNSNYVFATREYFRAFGLILVIPIIQVYSLLLLRYMLQPIRIRFTALSCFETNIYQRVFLRGRTHANKTVTDRQTKYVNKHLITVLSVRLI